MNKPAIVSSKSLMKRPQVSISTYAYDAFSPHWGTDTFLERYKAFAEPVVEDTLDSLFDIGWSDSTRSSITGY